MLQITRVLSSWSHAGLSNSFIVSTVPVPSTSRVTNKQSRWRQVLFIKILLCLCILIILWSFNYDTIYPLRTAVYHQLSAFKTNARTFGWKKTRGFQPMLSKCDSEYAFFRLSYQPIFYWVYIEAWTLSVFGFIVLLIIKIPYSLRLIINMF